MWQQGDSIFIGLLNNVRVGAVSEIDISSINSRSCLQIIIHHQSKLYISLQKIVSNIASIKKEQ